MKSDNAHLILRAGLGRCIAAALCACSSGLFAQTPVSSTAAPVVRIAQGSLRGMVEGGAEVFKNIPFASPPVGPLRWKPPQPAKGWRGVRDATAFGPACTQPSNPMAGSISDTLMGDRGTFTTSEDCLNLNVRRPKGTIPGKKLPVMLWIYGGAFSFGRNSQPTYAGTGLVDRGVILVTPNYRLGALGFLAHPELSAEDPHRSSGTYGALDTIAALQWVKRNIASFGGDPDNVTIFGQSAGAMIVGMLSGSPLTKGLFKRVISESGVYFTPEQKPNEPGFGEPTLSASERTGIAFLERTGATSIADARALPADRILASAAGGPDRRPLSFRPPVDGWFLPTFTYDLLRQGRYNATPVIVGSNDDEGSLALPNGTTLDKYTASVAAWGNASPQLLAAYPARNDAEALHAGRNLQRDSVAGWSAWQWAEGQTEAGGANVYFYNFDHRPPYPSGQRFDEIGATHGGELPYVFGTMTSSAIAWNADDRVISNAVIDYWTNFAKTGNPNGAGLPTWRPWSASGRHSMHFAQSAPIIGTVSNLERLMIFDAIYAARRSNRTSK